MSIMSNDQRDVSSALRFMDPQTLREYGNMHKSNPYIFPLVFQESQNRQKLYMNQQMQMAGQPQPKVVDQALAQMAPQPLPEDVGIGALPAPNMTMAAEGGIMGYEGYDEGPSDFGQGPVMMMAGGGVARYQVGGVLDSARARVQTAQQRLYTYGLRQRQQDPAGFEMAQQEMAAAQDALQNAEREISGGPVGVLTQPIPAAGPSNAKITPIDPSFRRQQDPRMQPGVAATAQPLITSGAASEADTGRKDTGRKDTGRKDERKDPSAKTDTGGLDSIINSYTRALDLGIGENRNARVGLAAALEQTPKTRAKRNAEERAKEGDVFAGREARLAEREKGIEGMGDKYLGLALLQAGAAMMSTPGNIGAALGKGIAVGSERYIAGIDKINAAKDKFAEARDRLEDLRLNRADMTKKEVREDQRAIDDGILQAKKLLADGATNDLKISADAQTKIFGAVADNFQTNKRLTSAEGIARLQAKTANRPGAEIQAVERIMAEKKIPFTEALALYNSNRREPQTAEMLLKAWTGNVLLQQQYPNPQDYVKMMSGSAGGASQLSPADKALVEKYSR